MSRSTREPIFKDHNSKNKATYHRIIRSTTNQKVRQCLIDPEKQDEIPKPQEIVDDYDYCDWIINYRDGWKSKDSDDYKRATRK